MAAITGSVITDADFVNEGTECRVTSCDENYFNPLEFSKITCKDTLWEGDLKCQLSQTPCSGHPQEDNNGGIQCSQDDLVPGESAYFDGTKCEFFCKTGWVAQPSNEQPEVQCNNGQWNNPYTCQEGEEFKLLSLLILSCTVIDGEWGQWGAWSSCMSDCTKSRVRSCDNPPPQNGGADCPGRGLY